MTEKMQIGAQPFFTEAMVHEFLSQRLAVGEDYAAATRHLKDMVDNPFWNFFFKNLHAKITEDALKKMRAALSSGSPSQAFIAEAILQISEQLRNEYQLFQGFLGRSIQRIQQEQTIDREDRIDRIQRPKRRSRDNSNGAPAHRDATGEGDGAEG